MSVKEMRRFCECAGEPIRPCTPVRVHGRKSAKKVLQERAACFSVRISRSTESADTVTEAPPSRLA